MPNENLRVIYAAFKAGMGFTQTVETASSPVINAPRPPAAPTENSISRFDAFKAFYESVATCPVTHKIMTDPVMAPDGHCYQRGSEPRREIDQQYWRRVATEPALAQGSNITLKKALIEITEKSLPLTEVDYEAFFEAVAKDSLSWNAVTDPILDAGYIRSRASLYQVMEMKIIQTGPERILKNIDTCATGAEWDENIPKPTIYIRYVQLLNAIVKLRDNLSPDEDIYKEMTAAKKIDYHAPVIYQRKIWIADSTTLQWVNRLSEPLADVVAADTRLTRDLLKNGVNDIAIGFAELGLRQPYHTLTKILAVCVASPLLIPGVFTEGKCVCHQKTNIEEFYNVSSDDREATLKVKSAFLMLLLLSGVLAKKGLDAIGSVSKWIPKDHTMTKLYVTANLTTAIAVPTAMYLTSKFVEAYDLATPPVEPLAAGGMRIR